MHIEIDCTTETLNQGHGAGVDRISGIHQTLDEHIWARACPGQPSNLLTQDNIVQPVDTEVFAQGDVVRNEILS